MYTIKQLQGMDYLLKKILGDSSNKIYNKNLKLLINIDGIYWYGDFLKENGAYITQDYIDGFGDIDFEYFNHTNEHSVLSPIWDVYVKEYQTANKLFRKSNELSMIFYEINRIVSLVEFENEETPFYPYLLNATIFTNREVKLPFITLKKDVNVISLIEVD